MNLNDISVLLANSLNNSVKSLAESIELIPQFCEEMAKEHEAFKGLGEAVRQSIKDGDIKRVKRLEKKLKKDADKNHGKNQRS